MTVNYSVTGGQITIY